MKTFNEFTSISEADLSDQKNTPKLKKIRKGLDKIISDLDKISYGRMQTNPLGIKWIKQLKAVTDEMGKLKGM